MKDRIFAGFFSVSGVALIVATAGFLSALVTMFVDVNTAVPVKALLCTVLVATSTCVVLLKIIYDLANEKAAAAPFEHPIKYISDERVLVIRRNENFINNIIVGCYSHQEDIERLAYVAVVHLVQDKVIQIKIRTDLGLLKRIPSTLPDLRALIIRPVVPVTALEQYNNPGESV